MRDEGVGAAAVQCACAPVRDVINRDEQLREGVLPSPGYSNCELLVRTNPQHCSKLLGCTWICYKIVRPAQGDVKKADFHPKTLAI